MTLPEGSVLRAVGRRLSVFGFAIRMTMNFHIFETSTMLLTSVSIAIVLMDGKAGPNRASLIR